jgi:sterol desaturase/sphingolipid hydroxylase (fatty acid hydroxylase superfamily)
MRLAHSLIAFGLQPALLGAALALWAAYRERPELPLFVMLGTQLVLGALEYALPARRDFVQSAREKLANLALFSLFSVAAGLVTSLYDRGLESPQGFLQDELGLALWPSSLPLAARVLLAFLASELIWYGIHRSEHRFPRIWRASGHGMHHSFQRLNAINFNANHPFEAFFILLPTTALTLVFGAREEFGGAAILVLVNASVVHANLALNTRGIGWVFTTNRYHFRHHSRVFDESNTNYGCASILWDRVFGTFSDGATRETGIGPSEPRFGEKLLLPLRQPEDVSVAP